MFRGPSLGIRKRLCDLNAEPRKRLRQDCIGVGVGVGAGGTVAVLLILLVPVQELVSMVVLGLVPVYSVAPARWRTR